MSDLKDQKTDKGWGAALSEANKDVLEKYKTKVQDIWEGIKATPDFIKKNIKKED